VEEIGLGDQAAMPLDMGSARPIMDLDENILDRDDGPV
jgi:hypothetical protein